MKSNKNSQINNDEDKFSDSNLNRSFSNNNFDGSSDQDSIDLKNFFKIFRRRKRIFISFGTLTFLLIATASVAQRIFSPTFHGFTLLITDPINKDNTSNNLLGNDESIFQQTARNITSNDIPTLIEVLKSPLLLEPISSQNNVSLKYFSDNLNITVGVN